MVDITLLTPPVWRPSSISCGDWFKGFTNKEVYVYQPLDFEDHENPDYVFKLKQVLYGLKQAPKA